MKMGSFHQILIFAWISCWAWSWTMWLCTGEYVDMTHYLDKDKTIRWPGQDPFTLLSKHAGPWRSHKWMAYNEFRMIEHMGTHLDAPYHFSKSGRYIGDLDLSDLIGPAVVIDIRKRAERDPNAGVSVSDLLNWEEDHGRIPDGAIVLMNSGWSRYWREGNGTAYFGGDIQDGPFNCPGFSTEAATFLVNERNIRMIGSDSANGDTCNWFNDPVHGVPLPVHDIVLPNDIFIIENVKNVGLIPPVGATVFVMPMNIEKGTGAPVRMFAIWGQESLLGDLQQATASDGVMWNASLIMLVFVLIMNALLRQP